MDLNPAALLNLIFNGLEGLIEKDGAYLYLVFVWPGLLVIVWTLSGSLRRKRLQRNSLILIPAIIFTMQSASQPPPPVIGIEVDQTWEDDDETMDHP